MGSNLGISVEAERGLHCNLDSGREEPVVASALCITTLIPAFGSIPRLFHAVFSFVRLDLGSPWMR